MTPLLEAALQLQTFLRGRDWRFCIIGGVAVLRWGEPRFTRDLDVTLLSGFGREDEFIGPLLDAGYAGRVGDAAEFARRNRTLLLQAPNGVPIDIALGGLPFEQEMVERASPFEFAKGCVLNTCSAEDLLVLKLFAFRQRDLLDAESVAERQHGKLDWEYIHRQLAPLAEIKEQPEILNVLERFRKTG